MLKSINLTNFRGFRDHTIDLTPFCLLIGQNNAGKTTLLEALRLVSTALAKAPSANFTMAPDWLAPDITGPVYRFPVDTIGFDQRSIHYNYHVEDPAIVKARYSNNCLVIIAVGSDPGDIYCQLQMPGGKKLNSRSQFNGQRFHAVHVMPPIGSLLDRETLRDKRYLLKHINGYLSYRHIRNQMAEMPAEFAAFKELLESTWDHLQLGTVEYGQGDSRDQFGISIRGGPFVSEAAWVGSGLQAWMQTLWFLCRVNSETTVVLDEPDVYLHADLQKKLIKILAGGSYRQVLVATHSLEMISSVAPTEIIAVTKREARSRPLSSNAQAQTLVEQLGTNHNIQLSKLSNSGRVLFVEGKDHAFLDQFAFKRGNVFYDRFSKIPHFTVGGMANWRRASMAAKAFHETSGGKVCSTLLIDRDYKSQDFLEQIVQEAKADSLDVRYWSRKELENYLIDKELISSYVLSRMSEPVEESCVIGRINSVIDSMSSDATELIADSYQASNRKLSLPTAMKLAKDYVKLRMADGACMADLISGKVALGRISDVCKNEFGVSFGAMTLCREMSSGSVPGEVAELLDALVAKA